MNGGLKRTYRFLLPKVQDAGKDLSTDLATKFDREGSGLREIEDPLNRVGSGLSGEPYGWDTAPACSCLIWEKERDTKSEVFRFCVPKAWELSSVSVSEGLCPICGQERRLRRLQYKRGRILGKEELESWSYCSETMPGREELEGDQRSGTWIRADAHEEDPRLPELDSEDDSETIKDMARFLCGIDSESDEAPQTNNEVAKQESVQDTTVWSPGPLYSWSDDDGENIFSNVAG